MPESLAAVGSWDVLVSPWHLEERIEGFPVPAGAVVLPASADQRGASWGGWVLGMALWPIRLRERIIRSCWREIV